MYGTVQPWGVSPSRNSGELVMRLSASFAASSAVAILSTALLIGPAVSQITTGPASPLPNVTVEAPKAHAPKQVAREHAPSQWANTRVSHRTSSTGSSTAQTPSAAPDSVIGRIAKLERVASSCNGGCETSVKTANAPWVGCSYTGENGGVSSFLDNVQRHTHLQYLLELYGHQNLFGLVTKRGPVDLQQPARRG
jgi:hypothetical protein